MACNINNPTPAELVADLVDHRASADAVPTRIARKATFQIFVFALLTHDPGKCSHPGVILTGATTQLSFFLAAPPGSFNLAQCEVATAEAFEIAMKAMPLLKAMAQFSRTPFKEQ